MNICKIVMWMFVVHFCVSLEVLLTSRFLHRIIQIHPVRWPSGLRRQLKVIPSVVHQYNRWSERAWVQIPLSSTCLLLFDRALRLETNARAYHGFLSFSRMRIVAERACVEVPPASCSSSSRWIYCWRFLILRGRPLGMVPHDITNQSIC